MNAPDRAEGTPLVDTLFALNPEIVGTRVVIEAVKHRRGRMHLVKLYLDWMPAWGCWQLRRYEEEPT